MRALLLQDSGFSLIEVMIAAFIGGIIFLGSTTMTTVSVKNSRNSEMQVGKLELATRARQILSIPSTCTLNLKDQVLDTESFRGVPVKLYGSVVDNSTNPPGIKKGEVLAIAGLNGKLEVNDFMVVPFAQLQSDVWLVKLQLSARKIGEYLGSQEMIGEVSAMVRVDASGKKIVDCLPLEGVDLFSENSTVLNEKICELASDGNRVYDADTRKCVSNVKCFPGTLTEASCPEDMVITGCMASGARETVDPNLGPTRQFKSGAKVPFPTDRCGLDHGHNTAICDYAMDADTSNAVCQACCKPSKKVASKGPPS